MIVPMQKVTVLCARSDRDAALRQLYELGVVHLQSGVEAPDGDLEARRLALQQLRDAVAVLTAEAGDAAAAPTAGAPAAIAADVVQLAAERSELARTRTALQQERAQVLPFGDFDPKAIAALRAAGVLVELYRFARGAEPAVPAGATLHVLSEQDGMVAVAVVRAAADSSAALPSLRPIELQARGLAAIEGEIAATDQRLAAIERELAGCLGALPSLQRAAADVAGEVELLAARATMDKDGAVAWLTGFCPAPQEAELRRIAAQNGMVVLARAVTSDDHVPTLLGGPPWVRQVHAVFEGIGIVPGYGEADVSAPFLLFLVLFAAMLIGDAGYGALLLVAAIVLWRKTARTKAGVPQALRLLVTTSIGTIVWGAITGTWFAIPQMPAALDAMRIEWLSGTDKLATTKHVMLFCFLLGAIHLTVAHLWAAVRSGKSLQVLAQFGWIACTWLMFSLANTMVLGEPFPGFMTTVALVGVTLIVLFMTPLRQIKHEWFNHVMLPLSLVSNFVDVVSYLRLFAVGSASVAVASSFNAMAVNAAAGGGLGWLTAALIAVFGHTLNLMLCAMGVLVHGVRLNTLEFSAHLGLQWSGVAYRPFGRRGPARDPQVGGEQ